MCGFTGVTYANARLPWQLKRKVFTHIRPSLSFFYHHSSSCELLPLTLGVTLHRSEKRLTKDSMSERRLIQSLTRHAAALCTIAKKCALSSSLGVSCLLRTPVVQRSSRSIASLPFCTNGWSALVVSQSHYDDTHV